MSGGNVSPYLMRAAERAALPISARHIGDNFVFVWEEPGHIWTRQIDDAARASRFYLALCSELQSAASPPIPADASALDAAAGLSPSSAAPISDPAPHLPAETHTAARETSVDASRSTAFSSQARP